ncbi:TPA: hypothetical protein PCJ94_002762 [Klebsiella quasipneumoniae]|nr:hypothetical protein [Klebsiella quasipneumoniae]
MTKSTITRERIAQIANPDAWVKCTHEEVQELARMALAAMDSELVAEVLSNRPGNDTSTIDRALPVGTQLYRHAKQPGVPETAHSSVIAEQLAHVLSDMKVTDHQRAVISCAVDRLNNVAQLLQLSPSALLVPEILDYQGAKELYNYLMTEEETNATVNAWNACRAAMLQASPVCTCPSGDGSLRWPCPVHACNSPTQSDCCPAQNSVSPAQGGNHLVIPDGYVMVPKEPTDEMIAAAMNCEDVLFNSDDSFCVQFGNIYEAMLAAAPQEVKGE